MAAPPMFVSEIWHDCGSQIHKYKCFKVLLYDTAEMQMEPQNNSCIQRRDPARWMYKIISSSLHRHEKNKKTKTLNKQPAQNWTSVWGNGGRSLRLLGWRAAKTQMHATLALLLQRLVIFSEGRRGLFTFHADHHTRSSQPRPLGSVGGAQPHITQACAGTSLHVRCTQALVHTCAADASVPLSLLSSSPWWRTLSPRHIASAAEPTQPVKTTTATGLENIQAALWDVMAIPDDAGSCLLRISTGWRPDADNY